MTSRSRFLVLASVLLAALAPASAQEHGRRPGGVPPPVPDGPTLEVPQVLRQPTTLEVGADVLPAGATDAPRTLPPGAPTDSALDWLGRPCVGEGYTTSSACQFDSWCQDGVFACGSTSTQYLLGAYISGRPGPRIPQFDYVLASIRHGWMLTCPEENWFGRGNYEVLLDLSVASVISGGYGDYFAGPTFILRYNWVEPGSCLVPYHQVGFGVVYTDAFKDRTQQAIGQQWEFLTRCDVGVRYFVSPNMSLDVEIGLQHLSNAGHADRNLGANCWGGQLGLTYFFPWGGS